MLKILLFLFSCCIIQGLKAQSQHPYPHPTNVGDTDVDPALDDTAFQLCNDAFVLQYYQAGTKFTGEKPALRRFFMDQFVPVPGNQQSGYVTIRFIVNCQGETGRFRVMQIDPSYQLFEFDDRITSQLLLLCKQLKGWIPGKYKKEIRDSYVYLSFRIENGKIIDIRP